MGGSVENARRWLERAAEHCEAASAYADRVVSIAQRRVGSWASVSMSPDWTNPALIIKSAADGEEYRLGALEFFEAFKGAAAVSRESVEAREKEAGGDKYVNPN